jgi:hypothetical protein
MAKSKLRNGAKVHRKRVESRNSNIKSEMKKQQNLFQQSMMEQLELMKQKFSAETKNQEVSTSETINLNTDGFIQSAEII